MKMDGGYMIIPEDGFSRFLEISAPDQGVIIDFLYGDGFPARCMDEHTQTTGMVCS
ncbi:MAG: hypothetical protein ACLVJO_03460 [[Clostridium] scindens]